MADRYEYHNIDDSWTSFYDTRWLAQTSTPTEAHKITSVKIKLARQGSPGTITVSIKETTDEDPSGEDLCSGTTTGNDLTTDDSVGEIREISLGAGYNLEADTMYAIVCRISGGDLNNRVKWRYDTAHGYPRGTMCYSSNSGSTWDPIADDGWFEDWGEAIIVGWTGKLSGVTNPAKIMGVDVANIAKVKGVA